MENVQDATGPTAELPKHPSTHFVATSGTLSNVLASQTMTIAEMFDNLPVASKCVFELCASFQMEVVFLACYIL